MSSDITIVTSRYRVNKCFDLSTGETRTLSSVLFLGNETIVYNECALDEPANIRRHIWRETNSVLVMAYEVYFVIGGRRAKLETVFTSRTNAEQAASGVEQEGYPPEIVDLNE